MSKRIGFSERVWIALRDNFPHGASAAAIADEAGGDATDVAQALNAMSKRGAVVRGEKDSEGHITFKANPDATFRRPRRAATGAGARGSSPHRRRTKADDRGQVHSASRQPRTAVTAGRDPHPSQPAEPMFAINHRYEVAVTHRATSLVLDKAAALKLLDFLGSIEPLLSTEE